MKSINKDLPKEVSKIHIDRAIEFYEKRKEDKIPPKAKEIIQYALGEDANENVDARSKFGKDLLSKLSTFGIFPNRAHQYTPVNTFQLTENQEEFIRNNACRIKWFDAAKQLFPEEPNMNPASVEARAVKAFYDALPENLKMQSDNLADKNYSAPKTLDRAVARVNKYILDGINKEKITNSQ